MERDNHPQSAEIARKVLATLLYTLELAKLYVENLRREQVRLR